MQDREKTAGESDALAQALALIEALRLENQQAEEGKKQAEEGKKQAEERVRELERRLSPAATALRHEPYRVVTESFSKEHYLGKVSHSVFEAIECATTKTATEPNVIVPVIQSSGWGKSRALVQCAVENLAYVIYLNARTNGTGWPAPMPKGELQGLLAARTKHQETVEARRDAFKKFFKNLISLVEEELAQSPPTPASLFDKMYTWSDTAFEYSSWFDAAHSGSLKAGAADAAGLSLKAGASVAAGDRPIWVVLDEASVLAGPEWELHDDAGVKSVYLAARSAFVDVFEEREEHARRVVFVPVATASSLSTIAPRRSQDASFRSGALAAVPVLQFYGNLDVLAEERAVLAYQEAGERTDKHEIAKLGRPLWATNRSSSAFAAEKLMGCDLASAWQKEARSRRAAAIIGALCSSFVLPQDEIRSLVEYNMCSAVNVLEDGNIDGEYVSEPTLAAGARHCLRNVVSTADVLTQQKITFSKAPANAGDLGECVAAIALLECMEAAFTESGGEQSAMFPVVKLRDLAKKIIPADLYRETDFPENAIASFNHFVRLPKHSFDEANRSRAGYRRCAGVVASVNEAVVDGEIPIMTASGTITPWNFQIKNRTQARQAQSSKGGFPMLYIEMASDVPCGAGRKMLRAGRDGNGIFIYHFSFWDMPLFCQERKDLQQVMVELCGLGRRKRLQLQYKC